MKPEMVAIHQARISRIRVSTDHRRPEFTADASPNLMVFCRVNELSAMPSQMDQRGGLLVLLALRHDRLFSACPRRP